MSTKSVYISQLSFASGEISPSVAARSDLEKYQSALFCAKNVIIEPYGGLHKRSGSRFLGELKYPDKKAMLIKFNFSHTITYLLEVGDKYIRVWKDGVYIGIEVTTPFAQEELSSLRFTQSADVMYICSGVRPVQQLIRYSQNDWQLKEFVVAKPPFMPVNSDEKLKISASATKGEVTLTATGDVFSADMVGAQIKLSHNMPAAMALSSRGNSWISQEVVCGNSWSLVTRGIWNGYFYLQTSKDGVTWEHLKTFLSINDFNASASGTVDEYTYMRIISSMWDGKEGSCTLNTSPYTHEGMVKITQFISPTEVIGEVVDFLGSTEATADWYLACWSDKHGYPYCATFFQDRLVFAGSNKQPNTIWMSKTGDYTNFSVQKAAGSVTEDSSIAASLISRELFSIRHLLPSSDLLVLTNGNEWVISGSDAVSPNKIVPKVQTSRGASEVEPLIIGNRAVYVQRSGQTVRDIGYTYESDNYTGADLSLLAKHLFKDKKIIDSAYSQEPNSIIYFVCNDGVMLCLTYLKEQDVYAWSSFHTQGKFEAVCCIGDGYNDNVYCITSREVDGNIVRYIERFDYPMDSDVPTDFINVDCAVVVQNDVPSDVVTGLEHLKGKQVQVVGDNYLFSNSNFIVDETGCINLPTACQKVVVGLGFEMLLELPSIEMKVDDGSLIGRTKNVTEVILQVRNSYGGKLGIDTNNLDNVIFEQNDAFFKNFKLFTGTKKITLPQVQDEKAKVVIYSDQPYPFFLSAVVRVVTFGIDVG